MASAATASSPYAFTMHAGVDKKLSTSASSAGKDYLPPTPPLTDDERENERLSITRLDQAADRPRALAPPRLVFERTMGDTELSYYLPSRADGVNDMYLHLGFRAPALLLAPARVRAAWAYMRLMHPPLATQVRMEPWAYASARFTYSPPRSVSDALAQADTALEFREESKDALIDAYLNGPRTLGNERLAHLILGNMPEDRTPLPTPGSTEKHGEAFPPFSSSESPESLEHIREYDLLICATHFVGDGMALHRFANEFFMLLAGRSEDGKEKTTEDIEEMLRCEWEARWGGEDHDGKRAQNVHVLPLAIEDAIPQVTGRFRRAAGKVEFQNRQKEVIGGHAFPRKKHPVRHTIVPTIPLDVKKTKAILKKCKENGVSIANAFFSLSALVWGRVKENEKEEEQGRELPVLMYSALNIRPHLLASATVDKSYWFTAIGYLNIILPSFLPASCSPRSSTQDEDAGVAKAEDSKRLQLLQQTFWHRARMTKKQILRAAKHPLLMSRTHEMARLRGARARAWAKEDDEKEHGIWVAPPPKPAPSATDPSAQNDEREKPWKLPPAPSAALIGLSMLGNLDATYVHAAYPALALHTLTTGSRQRSGAMLLFGYTFCGRLWLSLGYDENGFADGVVERWWEELLRGVDEFLVD